jgi:hypothetical protein
VAYPRRFGSKFLLRIFDPWRFKPAARMLQGSTKSEQKSEQLEEINRAG